MRSELPKVLHRLCGRSLVERAVRAVAGLKPENILVVVGYGREQVEQDLEQLSQSSKLGTKVKAVLQQEQRGTGDAVRSALSELPKNTTSVLIVPGDTPLLTTELLAALTKSTADLSFLTVKHSKPTGFGRIIRDSSGKILAIKEEKDCTEAERGIEEINVSLYLCKPDFLNKAIGSLKANNAQGEFYLTDIVEFAVTGKYSIDGIQTQSFANVAGANSRAELSDLEAIRRGEINREWMDKGVSFEDPARAYIDEDVTIGADSFIGSGARLKGKSSLESNVVVEGDSLIEDSFVGSGTRIKLGCSIETSRLGKNCAIGPFAHLRPGTELADEVHIGNFVETKKAILGKGAKANHLTYLGDTKVGAKSNIGAGTITCNYDGVKKHETIIGEAAFIGSNTSLVAPVKIGDRAVIGAGSVITKEVPNDALGLERSEQTIVKDWSKRKPRTK